MGWGGSRASGPVCEFVSWSRFRGGADGRNGMGRDEELVGEMPSARSGGAVGVSGERQSWERTKGKSRRITAGGLASLTRALRLFRLSRNARQRQLLTNFGQVVG